VSAPRVVEAVDVVRNPAVGVSFRRVPTGRFFVLQGRKEAFSDRVVPAVAFTTHARHEAKTGHRPSEVTAGVLAATVGVEQDAGLDRGPMPGVQEGVLDEVIWHPFSQAVAEHLSRLHAQHDSQVQPGTANLHGFRGR